MKNTAYFLVSASIIILALIYGESLLMPFILGLLFWYLLRGFKQSLDKIPFVKKHFPSWLKTIFSSAIIFGLLVFLVDILAVNINAIALSYEKYQVNVDKVVASINATFNLNLVDTVQAQMGDLDFGVILSNILNSLSDLVSNTFMIIIYSLFILLEESNFQPKLKAIFGDNEQYEDFNSILTEIESSIGEYFRLKALVSLITGFLSYAALLLIGVDSPEFWAFLIFILNFIPTIGSLIGTVFPAIFCLLQFGEVWPCVLVLLIVGVIQLIVGNILEPRLMGSSMNISPLVTILALSLWGAIWGVMGMILSVPITVVMIIICAHFEKTRPVAILLSEKGKVKY